LSDIKDAAKAELERVGPDGIKLSHQIHANPELGFAEHVASRLFADALAAADFDVTHGIADLPTAVAATFGSGDLTIGLFGEYDALPDIGHACGHNIIGSAAVTAGRLLARLADDLDITVRVFGCPAEEGGGGKILMLERGVFDGLHTAMLVHPAPRDIAIFPALAADHLVIDYTGRTAHASGAPHLGRNAADAFTVAQVGIGLLRQHLPLGSQIHGIVTNGGEAPNIVPGHTSGRFYVRAKTMEALADTRARLELCFEAGALSTGCDVTIRMDAPTYSHVEDDPDLKGLYQANAERLGREFIDLTGFIGGGSTDMGNVSLVIPTIHPSIGLDCGTAVNHQPEFTEFCGQPTGDRAVLDGALALAWTAIDAATLTELRARLLARSYSHVPR
jgi:amidohydrolase